MQTASACVPRQVAAAAGCAAVPAGSFLTRNGIDSPGIGGQRAGKWPRRRPDSGGKFTITAGSVASQPFMTCLCPDACAGIRARSCPLPGHPFDSIAADDVTVAVAALAGRGAHGGRSAPGRPALAAVTVGGRAHGGCPGAGRPLTAGISGAQPE